MEIYLDTNVSTMRNIVMNSHEPDTYIGIADADARSARQGFVAVFSFLVWALILAGYGLAVWAAISVQQ